MSSKKKDLTQKERLRLLENRHSQGDISDDTYNLLRNELECEMENQTSAPIPVPQPSPADIPSSKKGSVPVLPAVAIIVVVGIIILAVAASGVFTPSDSSTNLKGQEIIVAEKIQWEDMETKEGDITGGGPLTVVPNEQVPFEVADTVYQIDISLTWNPQSMDLDLVVNDPDGSERDSSGNPPGEPESVRIKGKIIPGTWTAVIDPFAAVNVHYNLEIIYYHESKNDTTVEGDILYTEAKILTQESGEQYSTFSVDGGYESLVIQVEISSSEGSMRIEILNPDGDEMYSKEVSGKDEIVEQETVDCHDGKWNANYFFDGFTGSFYVEIAGI